MVVFGTESAAKAANGSIDEREDAATDAAVSGCGAPGSVSPARRLLSSLCSDCLTDRRSIG